MDPFYVISLYGLPRCFCLAPSGLFFGGGSLAHRDGNDDSAQLSTSDLLSRDCILENQPPPPSAPSSDPI